MGPAIFRIYKIIFLKKIVWNMSMDSWTESTALQSTDYINC
jgi:hypothetical protein